MKKWVFIWQDDDLNMRLEELNAKTSQSAWNKFLRLHPDQGVIAAICGSDLEIDTFAD